MTAPANLFLVTTDAGLRRLRAMACQVLRPEVGGNPSRTRAFLDTLQLPPRPMGRNNKSGGSSEHKTSQSQPKANVNLARLQYKFMQHLIYNVRMQLSASVFHRVTGISDKFLFFIIILLCRTEISPRFIISPSHHWRRRTRLFPRGFRQNEHRASSAALSIFCEGFAFYDTIRRSRFLASRILRDCCLINFGFFFGGAYCTLHGFGAGEKETKYLN